MIRIEVALAIVHQAGWVLISQRVDDGPFANLWEFPGGKVEEGETPAACAAREVREEVSLEVAVEDALPTISHDYDGVLLNIHPFFCRPLGGTARPLASQKVRWVRPEALRTYAFPVANGPLLDWVVTRLSSAEVPTTAASPAIDFPSVDSYIASAARDVMGD